MLLSCPLARPALASTPADLEAGGAPPAEDPFDWLALPTLDYTTDAGFGFGASGGGYWYRGDLRPYKAALEVDLFLTTRWVQEHALWFDLLEPGGRPLRLQIEAGYNAWISDNFCGFAGDAGCDPGAVDQDASAGDPQRYYQLRHAEPYGALTLRRALRGQIGHRGGAPLLELFGGWSGAYYLPGTPGDPTPWPGSLYATAYFPDGERGLLSAAQLGASFDARDDERDTRRGVWIDASVRGAAPWIGSDWRYVGANLTARGYAPLARGAVVAATRAAADGAWGDLPTLAMRQVGGLQPYVTFGGAESGRGIRYGRYPGRLKLLVQQELRWTFLTLRPDREPIELAAVAFVDAGWIAEDAGQIGDAARAWGTGGGLRFIWDEDIIIRLDVGASPVEGWAPFFYIDFGQVF